MQDIPIVPSALRVSKTRKKSRRGATWTEDEVQKLLTVWKKPGIIGYLGEKKGSGTNVLKRVVSTLESVGVQRSAEEVRAKVKNIKGDYRKAKDNGNPEGFRYFSKVESIIDPRENVGTIHGTIYSSDQERDVDSILARGDGDEMDGDGIGLDHPVQIEFELMSDVNGDFESIKGTDLPIEIEGGSLILKPDLILPSDFTGVDVMDPILEFHSHNFIQNSQDKYVSSDFQQEDSPSDVIVITTTDLQAAGHQCQEEMATTATYLKRENSCRTQRLSATEIKQKRQKFKSISDKMTATVSKVLSSTTETLIAEIKASEERFMRWEEKRRVEEQKREESMLKLFIEAIKSTPMQKRSTENIGSQKSQSRDQYAGLNVDNFEDSIAETYDTTTKKLTKMIHDQFKETQDNLEDWEKKMDRQEAKHNEKLFDLLITAARNNGLS